jgi:dTDP-4-amino-4,6-dideoxygalactose transaminase
VKRIYLSPPHLSGEETERLADALDSNWIAPLGPHVEAFEEDLASLTGTGHAVALSSGTAALHLALRLLDVGPGDEVLCPTLTFVASANAIRYCGATPVFVDSDAHTWNVDPSLVAEALAECAARGRLPKAVMSVDLYGQCADYDRLEEICGNYGVPIVEDAAEALGASYRGRPAGSFGSMAAISFNGNKIVTTSGGGALVARNKKVIERARHLATQARDPAPHYQHSEVGYNYRLSNLLAAVGRAQLGLLEKRVERKRAIFDQYVGLLGDLPGIDFQPEAAYGRSNRWLTCVTVDEEAFGADRETIRLALEAENIESRPLWKPMHLQPLYRDCRLIGGTVAERQFQQGLCVPSGTALETGDIERIAGIIRSCCRSKVERP